MPDKQKKNICFFILPGFNPDSNSVGGIKQALESLGYPAFSANFWGNNEKKDFSKLTIEECRIGIKEEIEKLSKNYEYIIGIGISLGGALLLDYAKNEDGLYCVVSVGTPFKLRYELSIKFGLIILPLLRLFYKLTNRKSKWVASGKVVRYLTRDFIQDVDRVRTRVLLLHSTFDFVAEREVVDEFLNMMSSTDKQVVYIKDTDHVINYDSEIILPAMFDFLSLPGDNLDVI